MTVGAIEAIYRTRGATAALQSLRVGYETAKEQIVGKPDPSIQVEFDPAELVVELAQNLAGDELDGLRTTPPSEAGRDLIVEAFARADARKTFAV